MFDLNRRPTLWTIGRRFRSNMYISSVSYQQATLQKYDWGGEESPNGYGPLDSTGRHSHFSYSTRDMQQAHLTLSTGDRAIILAIATCDRGVF